jgi:uncharacterized protein
VTSATVRNSTFRMRSGRDAAVCGEFSLGHIVSTRKEVDALLAKAQAAGAPVTELHDRPWGIYSGYFRDLDGHLREIIHNPNVTS